jgi:hypothetical protein
VSVKRFIFWVLPVVALSLTLFAGHSETAPSVTEVTELIKARINRMTCVRIAREAEIEAYRESANLVANVSADQRNRTPAEIEEALTAKCAEQLANLMINSVSVGEADATELGNDNRKTRFWPVEFQVVNPTEPTQNLHAVMFCYRDPEGDWASKIIKLDLMQNGTVCVIPKYAFREMGLE